MQDHEFMTIGRIALLVLLYPEEEKEKLLEQAKKAGFSICMGRVGSMDSGKIFAAVSTAAKREGMIRDLYREEHAVYHSTLEAYNGICRGQPGLSNVLRSAGLSFSIVRGPRHAGDSEDGDWLAVVLFGNFGAPIRGSEHEVIGMGMNPIS